MMTSTGRIINLNYSDHHDDKHGQGNYVGMTEAEMDAADPKELAAKVAKATEILYKVGFQRWANLNGWVGDYNKWMVLMALFQFNTGA